jgi:hypothetical protein
MMVTEVKINKQNATVAKCLRPGSAKTSCRCFLARALPAVTGGAIIGVSVSKAAILAGAMAVLEVVQKLACGIDRWRV